MVGVDEDGGYFVLHAVLVSQEGVVLSRPPALREWGLRVVPQLVIVRMMTPVRGLG